MVQINFAQKSVTVKIVYYGPGMSGKTTNLEVVHQRAPDNSRGELTSISTDGDRTLFFDFMPLDLGTVAGMRTQFQIYTVPGQVYYNSTRKLVLQGTDGVIFIADSSASMLQENLESLKNLEENLAEYGKDINTTPYVIQWNKRDLPDAMPVEELEKALNPRGVPSFEASANSGQGVFPTLKALAALVLDSIHEQTGSGGSGASAASALPAEVAPTPAAPPMAAAPAQPPVQSAGTGFYPSSQVAPILAQPAQPAQSAQQAQPMQQPQQAQQQQQQPALPNPVAAAPPQAPMPQAPMPQAPTASAPPASVPQAPAPEPQAPIAQAPAPAQDPGPQTVHFQAGGGGVPNGFPQPASMPQQVPQMQQSADSLSKTQVHAPPHLAQAHENDSGGQFAAHVAPGPAPAPAPAPHQAHVAPPAQQPMPESVQHVQAAPALNAQAAPAPQPAGLHETSLRMAPRAIAEMPGGAQPVQTQPMAQAGQQVQQPPLMQVNPNTPVPPPSAQTRAMPAPGRIKPRSNALPTPKDSSAKRSAVITAVFVTLALVAGIAIGGFAFNIF